MIRYGCSAWRERAGRGAAEEMAEEMAEELAGYLDCAEECRRLAEEHPGQRVHRRRLRVRILK